MQKYSVVVTPNAKHLRVVQQPDGSLRVWLTASAIEGKANKQLLNVLSEYFDRPKTSIVIARGKQSKKKSVVLL